VKIGIVRERRPNENRVSGTPDTIKKFTALGLDVIVESGAGNSAGITDANYVEAGATLVKSPEEALGDADIVLKVQKPICPGAPVKGEADEVAMMKEGSTLVCLMEPFRDKRLFEALAARGVSCFAMELVPRISRAQSMDVLSSQSNLAGYKAVIEAGAAFGRAFPMMMTAAGTVPPAKCLIMGAGVAGLQAIATARRLGGVVSATDVRPAAKEQVESLGASFVAVEDEEFKQAETAGGYAKEMSQAYKDKQAELIAATIAKQDIVICTALIPGRPAPVLVTEEMVKSMKPGSVIVDLAVEQGGNCPLSKLGKVTVKHGVTLIGYANMPSRVAIDASALYAKNLLNFVTPLVASGGGAMSVDQEDEIVKGTLVTTAGEIVHASILAIVDGKKKSENAATEKVAS
jgi:H+-translocating NAD(P) transhydrogenase subunit alpha